MKKCPRALRQSEIMTNESGILLKREKRTVLPIMGGNIIGKYNAIVMPMKPMAVICIHISYKENRSAKIGKLWIVLFLRKETRKII